MNETTSSRWDRFGAFVARRRLFFLLAAGAVTALCAAYAPRVTMSGDATSYLPQDRPEVRTWKELTQRFGGFTTMIVGLEEPVRALSSDGLTRVVRITEKLAEMKSQGVLVARSIGNIETLREDQEGTLNAENLVRAIPRTDADLDALAGRILADVQVPGSLVSRDLRAYVIILQFDPRQDPGSVADKVMDLVESERGPLEAVYYGSAFVTNQIGRRVYAALPWVVPVFTAGLLLVLLLWLRRPVASLVVLACAAVPLLWWMGFLRLLGMPVTVAVMNGALLLLAVGAVAFGRAAEARLRGAVAPVSRRTAELLVAAACAFGVLGLLNRTAPDSLPYLAQFGEGMVVGWLSLMLFGLLGATPLLSYLKPDPDPQREAAPRRATAGRRTLGLAAVVLLTAVSIFGAWRMQFAVGLRDLFSAREDVGQSLAFFDRRFGGADLLQVGVKGDLRDPGTMQRLLRLTDLLEGTRSFGDVRSVAQVLGFIGKGMAGAYAIPSDREALANLWFFLDGNADVRPLATDDRDEAMLALRIPPGTPGATLAGVVEQAIRDSEARGKEAARLRLESLARIFPIDLPPDRTARLLAAATGEEAPADAAGRRYRILEALKEYMASGGAPFEPSDADWAVLAGILSGPLDGLEGRLATALPGLESWKAAELPEDMAGRLADTLAIQVRDREVSLRADALTAAWLEGKDPGKVPPALVSRARGVFVALLAGEVEPEAPPGFTLSGFPALEPVVAAQLMEGLRRAIGVVLGVFLVLAVLAGIRRPGHLRAIPEAVVATLLTLALGTVSGLQVDSNSATLYLLPAVVTWFLSPGLSDPEGRRGRFPWAFAVAFAVAGLSLLLLGVLPLVRLGAVMAIGLLASAGTAAVGSWLWDGPAAPPTAR